MNIEPQKSAKKLVRQCIGLGNHPGQRVQVLVPDRPFYSSRPQHSNHYITLTMDRHIFRLQSVEKVGRVRDPTNSFTILEPRNQEIGAFCVDRERRATDF